MTEEKNKQTEEQTVEKLAQGILSVLSDISKVQITFRDSMTKLKFYHTAQALNNVLDHIALDIKALTEMFEKEKEVKK